MRVEILLEAIAQTIEETRDENIKIALEAILKNYALITESVKRSENNF